MASIADFEIHVSAICKALKRGNAAVMVGSGFSRNAENGSVLKSWNELAQALFSELSPGASSPVPMGTSEVLQLAEQYVQVFSRTALDDFLRTHIPDERATPGVLHELLLDLPWSEIFTTNYDTLLERAAAPIIDRAHFTVMCREDIPQSKILGTRRIVKLHGSFPSQRPFIFTEEDYRKYPADFAPFVNMVRQSLLENVFCLVGFSGDDPNFLHWIGWVRDMLDQHALRIYLFLDREPTLGVRRLLESRNVVPVVLPTPVDGGSDYATLYENLFERLALCLVETANEWPPKVPSETFAEDFLGNLDKRYEHYLTSRIRLRSVLDTYPGWLVVPRSVRQRLDQQVSYGLENTEHQWLLDRIEQAPVRGVVVLEQYAWYRDVLLQSINDRVAEISFALLDKTKTLCFPGVEWPVDSYLSSMGIKNSVGFRAVWIKLALSLVRWSREQLDEARLLSLTTALQTIAGVDKVVVDELRHEAILLALYQGARDRARQMLLDWEPEGPDVYMLIRKGALLCEVGEFVIGQESCSAGLQRIRRNQRLNPENRGLLSLEAWACLIARNLRQSMSWQFDSANVSNDRHLTEDVLSKRLADLAARGFDPTRDLEQIENGLDTEVRPPSVARHGIPGFDIGTIRSQSHPLQSSEVSKKIEAGFAWLTATDRVGFVPRVGLTTWNADTTLQAGWWIRYRESLQRVLALPVRSLSSDVFKDAVAGGAPYRTGWFSRFQVGRFNQALAIKSCESSFALALSSLEASASGKVDETAVRFHIELFSRLVLRHANSDTVFAFAERLVRLYLGISLPRVPRLWEEFENALCRVLEALPDEPLIRLLPTLLQLPDVPARAANESPFTRYWCAWPDLYDRLVSIEGDEPLKQAACDSVRRSVAVLRTFSSPNGTAPFHGIWSKIFWCNDRKLLDDAATAAIRDLYLGPNALWPAVPGMPASSIFSWCSHTDEIRCKFKRWLLQQRIQPLRSVATKPGGGQHDQWRMGVLDVLLQTWSGCPADLAWSVEELVSASEIVRTWWDHDWVSVTDKINLHAERGLGTVADELRKYLNVIDGILARDFAPRFDELMAVHPMAARAVETIVKDGSQVGAQFWAWRMRRAIRTDDADTLIAIEKELIQTFTEGSSVQTLYDASGSFADIVEAEKSSEHLFVPNSLLDFAVSVLATSHMPVLPAMLHLLTKLAQVKPDWFTSARLRLVDIGLSSLLRELDYQRDAADRDIAEEYVPDLRLRCAQLALVLRLKRRGEDVPMVRDWLALERGDPLPEMRHFRERRGALLLQHVRATEN